jgi:hypothetical protein
MGCGNSQQKQTACNADKTLLKEETDAKGDKNSEKEVAKRVALLQQSVADCRTASDADIDACLSALPVADRAKLMRALEATKPKSLDEYVALAEAASPTELEAVFKGLSADARTKVHEVLVASRDVQNTDQDESQPPATGKDELNGLASLSEVTTSKDELNFAALDAADEVNVELAADEVDGGCRKSYCGCV